MYNQIVKKPDKCYGCGACIEVCPKKCLKLGKDNLGFKKVIMTDENACISCGACSKVCEALNMQKGENIQCLKRYYAQNKDSNVLKRSSSGGVFTALAEYVFRNNGYVWGVQMNGNGKNEFKCASNVENLKSLCGSKYVEVDTALPFSKIKEQVQEGKLVLFSGTPCQVQAVNLFLKNKKYDNLILVDLLCYGVQSPAIWEKYISEVSCNNSKISNVQMRYKEPSWENYAMKIEFDDGTIYKKSRWKDPYLLSYATNLYNRTICMNCEAKKFPRVSDITLGDFWQIDTLPVISKEINIDSGISIVLAHNEKGNEILKQLDEYLYMHELPKQIFTNMIERFSGCSKKNSNKEQFFKQLKTESFEKTVKDNIDSQTYTWLRFKYLKVKRILKRIKN